MRYLFQQIHKTLCDTNWNVEEAKEALKNNKKRSSVSTKTNKRKKRKLNDDEDVDVDSDEGNYKDKVFNRYINLQ